MPTYRLTVEYDGGDFCGWQVQPGLPTIQQALEEAASTALRRRVGIVGSGRTDTGVHARAQVAHFVLEEEVDPYSLLASLNGILPDSIAVRSLERATDGFHARFDARLRHYHYYVTTGFRALDRHTRYRIRPDTDFDLMNLAAGLLYGEQNFSTFCRTQSETENRICHVHRAVWIRESHEGDWYFEIAADRFLYGMVRTIVGTLLEIGQGKREVEDLPRILMLKDRRSAGPAVPPFGLILEKVCYADELEPSAKSLRE